MEGRLLVACSTHLASEIGSRAQILQAAAPGDNRCELLLENRSRGGTRARLCVDLNPLRACLYLTRPTETIAAASPFLRSLIGRWIVGVDRLENRPLLRLSLRCQGDDEVTTWLVFEWLGGRPQALLVDARSRHVLDTLSEETGPHSARRARGVTFDWPSPPRRPLYDSATPEQVEEILTSRRAIDPMLALARGFAGLPAYLAYEALADGCEDAASIASRLREIASRPTDPVLYRLRASIAGLAPVFVSPIPLRSLAEHRSDRPGSLFHLLEHAHEAVLLDERKNRVFTGGAGSGDSEIRRLTRLHRRLAAEGRDTEEAPVLRRHAEALLIHVAEIKRGASCFHSPDPSNPEEILEIDLDPALTVPENADRLFRRAKRLERGEPLRRRRIRALEEVVTRLSELHERGRTAGASLGRKGGDWVREACGRFARPGVIEAWERRVASDSAAVPRKKPRDAVRKAGKGPVRKRSGFHPRTYKTREGWTVIVGRSNAENDYVSHTLAHSEDYWFHVHGCPGSHVVLRREGRADNPSRATIAEVASIAAYFSKAKTSRKAPVVYTLKKYVRKPRGGAPGLALVTRETTIMVEPRAPEEADPGGWGDDDID